MFEVEGLETTSPSHLHFTDEETGSDLPKVTLEGGAELESRFPGTLLFL